MRLRLVGIAAILATVAFSQSGAAAPERNQVIRMGNSIGKVQLGMTMAGARRALGGRHRVVYHRADFGTFGRYLELGWEVQGGSWEPVLWRVGFRSWTRGGPMRVVRVSTTARSQRTPRRLGVGSRPRHIVKAYPHATCVSRGSEGLYKWDWVVVEERGGGMTAFNLDTFVGADYGGDENLHKVVAVMVQREWFSRGPGHRPCPPGWQRW